MNPEEELRPYTWGTEGRLDTDGNVWYACDPYPTWYRWEGRNLILPDEGIQWKEVND